MVATAIELWPRCKLVFMMSGCWAQKGLGDPWRVLPSRGKRTRFQSASGLDGMTFSGSLAFVSLCARLSSNQGIGACQSNAGEGLHGAGPAPVVMNERTMPHSTFALQIAASCTSGRVTRRIFTTR